MTIKKPFLILGNPEREQAFAEGVAAGKEDVEKFMWAMESLRDDLQECVDYIKRWYPNGDAFFNIRYLSALDNANRIIEYFKDSKDD